MVPTGLLLEDPLFFAAEDLYSLYNSNGLPIGFAAVDPTMLVGMKPSGLLCRRHWHLSLAGKQQPLLPWTLQGRSWFCPTLGPGLPAAFSNPVHTPDPRTLATLGTPILHTPAPWQHHTCVPQALKPLLLWASQNPRIWSYHHLWAPALFDLCSVSVPWVSAHQTDASATTIMRVPTDGPGATRDLLSHNIPKGEKEIRRCLAAFITEDHNSPHGHFSHLQLRTPAFFASVIPSW